MVPLSAINNQMNSNSSSSRRHKQRIKLKLQATKVYNNIISSIHTLHNSFSKNSPSSVSVPDFATFGVCQCPQFPFCVCHNNKNQARKSSSPSFPKLSASQSSLSRFLWKQARQFVRSRPTQERDADLSSRQEFDSGGLDTTHGSSYSLVDPSDVTPIIADKVSLPDEAGAVNLLEILPPDLVEFYSQPGRFLRSTPDPSAAGSRLLKFCSETEYLKLLQRLRGLNMVEFTAKVPKALNGLFGVKKPDGTIRLIIDARTANGFFVEPDKTELPNAEMLVDLHTESDGPLFVGKTDLADYYHRIKLPEHLRSYFALPPVRAGDLGLNNFPPDLLVYPQCVTLPMGWSHSVRIAQLAHEFILDNRSSLKASDRITERNDLSVGNGRVRLMVYIDDVVFIGTSRKQVRAHMSEYERTMRRSGFLVKPTKKIKPTMEPVEALGFSIVGKSKRVMASPSKVWSLLKTTRQMVASGYATGNEVRVLIGKWTWLLLVNRPTLSVMNAVYRFIESAGPIKFELWPSVRAELVTLCGLAPLLSASFAARTSKTVIAVDASNWGEGVVSAKCKRSRVQDVVVANSDDHRLHERFIRRNRWKVAISAKWKRKEHINVLELRAVKTALSWFLTTKKSIRSRGRRLLLFTDSQVVHGVLKKGRTSSHSLLVRARAVAALLLCSGIRLSIRWVSTHLNPADGPSRGSF